jgi:hypothetical protein
MINDEHILALLAASYQRQALTPSELMLGDYRLQAVDTLYWAKTEGFSDLMKRLRHGTPSGPACEACGGKGWREPTYEENHITAPSGLPSEASGLGTDFTRSRDCCIHCNPDTGHCDAHCPPF